MALSTKQGRSVSPKLPEPGLPEPGVPDLPASESSSTASSPFLSTADSAAERPWRRTLREAVRDPAELCRLLELPSTWAEPARRAAETFGLFVPRGFLARMTPGDPFDPLLRQVLPVEAETATMPGFTTDPVGDGAAEREAGLLQKYVGRVLLITTGVCAVHCRYCFRRHYPYADAPKSLDAWLPALEAIAADPTIEEVILSGGDPLMLVDELLEPLVRRLEAIPHVQRLRLHTRLPIVVPERVDERLLRWFSADGTRLTPICVVHANHARELNAEVASACDRLQRAGVVLLNQAVLLRAVNDSPEALEALCRRLVELRVVPYYLHQMDRVAGAAHFEVPEEQGRRLVAALRTRLPGYAVPRYVRERPGAEAKTDV